MPSNPPTSSTWIPSDAMINEGILVDTEDELLESLPSIPSRENSLMQDVTNLDYSKPLNLSANFSLRYCGMLQSVQGLGHSEEDHEDLIMTIGQAQNNGQFIYSERNEDRVILNLSKYGIKIMEAGNRSPMVTRWRHSLMEVIRAVHFVDITRKTYLAIKLGKFGDDMYDSLLFECEENRAAEICRIMRMLFEAVCSPDE